MSDRLTAAGEARQNVLRKMASGCPKTGRCTCVADVDALEAEAAARAVDEALSVERVAEYLGKHVDFAYWEDRVFHSPEDVKDLAADLVAHLRGPRDG